jgi:hypothetical protein
MTEKGRKVNNHYTRKEGQKEERSGEEDKRTRREEGGAGRRASMGKKTRRRTIEEELLRRTKRATVLGVKGGHGHQKSNQNDSPAIVTMLDPFILFHRYLTMPSTKSCVLI